MANCLCSNSGGRWTEYRQPFVHIHGTDIFAPETYRKLSEEFATVVEHTLSGTRDCATMARSTPDYDALILAMSASLCDNFVPMFTCEWKDRIARLFSLPLTSRIDGALHHVPRGSRPGWLHTDLCSGWFVRTSTLETGQEPVFPDRSRCDYFRGVPHTPDVQPEEYIRAVSMIYYLNNDGWTEGEGGETGLYSTARSNIGPRKAIPPKNNTLILFECTPHSFHRLLANPGRHRNSIVVWFHTTSEFGAARWGGAIARNRAS